MRRPVGLEWGASAATLAGASLLAINVGISPWAYPVMLGGSLLWVASAVKMRDHPLMLMNIGFVLINSIGIWRWLL